MLTTRYVREHIDDIKNSLKRRNSDYPIDELIKLDEEWRHKTTKLQELQAQRNKASLDISKIKKEGKDIGGSIAALAELKSSIDAIESSMPGLDERINDLLWNLPNILHESVPSGSSAADNIEIKKWGEIKKKEGKNHEEILTALGLLDMDSASKVAGSRFYFLKGDLALLEQSLIRFVIDELVKKGFTLISPPFMIKKKYFRGAAPLGVFEDALYRTTEANETKAKEGYEKMEEDLFLIGTAEHAMAAMHADATFSVKDLPIRYVGISPCFRREAGSHGKDTKGIFRVHQFYKVEQFIFSRQEDSWKYLEELRENGEDIIKKLEIPYHVVILCTGDIGAQVAKTYDVEVYMPGQKDYRELQSHSNCTDWQSLRLDIKYDEGNERKYVHTLNGTGLPIERAITAIVENYSNDDGSITVPKVLVPYMGKDRIEKLKA